MAKYSDEFISFDLPRDWVDKSVIAYAAPQRDDGSSAGSVVMTREQFGNDLKAFVERRLLAISGRSEGFVLRGHSEEELGGRASIVVDYVSEQAVQRLAAIDLDGENVAMLTLSTSHADAEAMEPLFERMLHSLELS
jgi:hypothetical protein